MLTFLLYSKVAHSIGKALLGGVASSLVVAIPVVDDGLLPSEILMILLGFIGGTGLTATRGGVTRSTSA